MSHKRVVYSVLLLAAVLLSQFEGLKPLAAQSTNTVVMITLNGKCWLKVAAKELQCVPKLLNTNYPDGRTGFYIVSVDDETYAWSGKGGHKPSPDSQVLLVDQFIATIKGKTTGWPANGSCEYQNPYRGKPTTVTCKATYGDRLPSLNLSTMARRLPRTSCRFRSDLPELTSHCQGPVTSVAGFSFGRWGAKCSPCLPFLMRSLNR